MKIPVLDEVTIKTKKPLYVQRIDRLEVNVQSSATGYGPWILISILLTLWIQVQIPPAKEFKNNRGTLSLNFSNILNKPFFDSEAVIPELDIEQKLSLDFDTRVIKLSYYQETWQYKCQITQQPGIRVRRNTKKR